MCNLLLICNTLLSHTYICVYNIYNELFHHIPTIIIQTISVGVDQSLLLTWTKYVRYVHQELVAPGGVDWSSGDSYCGSVLYLADQSHAEVTGSDYQFVGPG